MRGPFICDKNVKVRRFLSCASLIVLATESARACVCGAYPSAKQAWLSSPVVFVGSVAPTDASQVKPVEEVRVEEAFKGVRVGDVLKLFNSGGDCTPRFRPGQRVVLYLHPSNKMDFWEAWGCDRSRDIKEAADDLLFLRALPGALKGTRLSGDIELSLGRDEFKALPSVRVKISREGNLVDTITNSEGVFEVYGLAPGEYRIEIGVPADLQQCFVLAQDSQPHWSGRQFVMLGPDSGASVLFFLTRARTAKRLRSREAVDYVCLSSPTL